MRIMKYALIGVLLIGGAIYFIGSSLPEKYSVSRKVYLQNVMAVVLWDTLMDMKKAPEWNTELTKVEEVDHPKVPGLKIWRCTAKNGMAMDLLFRNVEDYQSFRSTIENSEELGFGGEWVYSIYAEPNGTRITITENGTIKNPLMRFVFHKILGADTNIKKYLVALGKKFSLDVTPEVVAP